MEFFKPNTRIDFMRQRFGAAIFSVVLIALSLVVLGIYGLNLGLDFTGGTQIELKYERAVDFNKVRSQVHDAGFHQAVVQPYGSTHDVLIRIGPQKNVKQKLLKEKIEQALPGAVVQQMQYIGPQVGRTLVTNGILAILVSLLATMLYIALRFEYRFAISAAAAIIHDPIITLGIFAFFGAAIFSVVLIALSLVN